MKYWSVMLCFFLFACGKNAAQKDAEAVCDCLHKAWDSGSLEEKTKCLDLQRKSGEKYMSNPQDLNTFNQALAPCLIETLGKQK